MTISNQFPATSKAEWPKNLTKLVEKRQVTVTTALMRGQVMEARFKARPASPKKQASYDRAQQALIERTERKLALIDAAIEALVPKA
jgi:hypothetical protein